MFGNPRLSLIAFGGDDLDMLAVGERLYAAGWFSSRLRDPDGIHLMVSPAHLETMPAYLDVLTTAVEEVRSKGLTRSQGGVSYAR